MFHVKHDSIRFIYPASDIEKESEKYIYRYKSKARPLAATIPHSSFLTPHCPYQSLTSMTSASSFLASGQGLWFG